ncbi:MAG: mechanosensitive ion channel [Lachnospiraceae bacterium]|nr:mechanosensitive ion channel [Lachnospiraceae bacterium]MBQ7775633.1 mechanosensitive ion channel [Lachnospiraceae bacterium]
MINTLINLLVAILLLVVAFIAANIVKKLVIKLLNAVNAEKLLGKIGAKEEVAKSAIQFVGKLVYFVTFLLFLPGVLDRLGMDSVSAPITNMVNKFVAFVPNLVAAGIIIAVGLFIANLVKDLLVSVLKAVKVDALQEKAGIKASENASFSSIIANVVYGVIVLVVITTGLDQLAIPAISNPANNIVASIFAIIPSVLAAIVIIAAGVFIAKLVAKLLESLLAGVGADSLLEKVTGSSDKKVSLSKIISEVVKYVLVVIFLVQGINVLNLPVLTGIGEAVLGYLPAVLTAVIILAIGMFAANTAEAAIVKKFPNAKASALVAKVVIYVFVGFVCLSQLGVAITIVEKTFVLAIAALCVAFAVAFGVGGRNFAANMLEKLEKKIDNNEEAK